MLSILNLNKTYGNGIHALQDVSLAMEPGIFGLLGPNGAGKSSLMRTLATLQDANSGSITLDGLDVLRQPQLARRRLGYLPQDFGVYPQVSAEDLLNQLAVFKGFTQGRQRREMVAHQLQLVNLYEQRHQKLGTFSGGMRQRFGIAQALLGAPQLMIVDEPTAGLDPSERIRFQNLLAEISQDRVLLLSTHIVEDVADLCSQMAILQRGRIVLQGRPSALVEAIAGQVWTAVVAPSEAAAAIAHGRELHPSWQLINTRHRQQQQVIRGWCPSCPGPGFEAAKPDLNDVYFTALSASTVSATVSAAP